MADRECNSAYDDSSDEETQESQEKPFTSRLRKMPVVGTSHSVAHRNDGDQNCQNRRDHQRPNPETSLNPEHGSPYEVIPGSLGAFRDSLRNKPFFAALLRFRRALRFRQPRIQIFDLDGLERPDCLS